MRFMEKGEGYVLEINCLAQTMEKFSHSAMQENSNATSRNKKKKI